MAELPAVVPGEAINSSTFGNPVIARVLSRYADATARDFAVPIPVAGDFAYLTTTGVLQVYDGTTWQDYVTLAAIEAVTGPTAYDWREAAQPVNTNVRTLIASLTAPAKAGTYLCGFSATYRLLSGQGDRQFNTYVEVDSTEEHQFLAGGFADTSYFLPLAYRVPLVLAGGETVEIWADTADSGQSSVNDMLLEVRWIQQ